MSPPIKTNILQFFSYHWFFILWPLQFWENNILVHLSLHNSEQLCNGQHLFAIQNLLRTSHHIILPLYIFSNLLLYHLMSSPTCYPTILCVLSTTLPYHYNSVMWRSESLQKKNTKNSYVTTAPTWAYSSTSFSLPLRAASTRTSNGTFVSKKL